MGIEVKMYDAATNELISIFDSISAASYEYDISVSAIKRNLQGKTKSTKGYIFRSDKLPNKPYKHYIIRMYDVATDKWIKVFDCLEQAANETGISKSTIWKNLTGLQKTVCKKQYYFRSDDIEYKPKNPEPYIQKGKPKQQLRGKVDVFDADDELVGTFDSLTAAAQFIGCKPSQVTYNIKASLKYKERGLIYKKYYCKLHRQ